MIGVAGEDRQRPVNLFGGLAPIDAAKDRPKRERDRPRPDRAAGGGGPLDMARGQIPFRSGFRPPNAN
jgi:hypothetical protein